MLTMASFATKQSINVVEKLPEAVLEAAMATEVAVPAPERVFETLCAFSTKEAAMGLEILLLLVWSMMQLVEDWSGVYPSGQASSQKFPLELVTNNPIVQLEQSPLLALKGESQAVQYVADVEHSTQGCEQLKHESSLR